MCGRYTLRTRLNQLLQLFEARSEIDWEPRYNIAPTQQIAAIRSAVDSPTRELVSLRWGLVPSWANDLKMGASLINARAETVAEKPSFRTAFKRRRCLILADGFYEWPTDSQTKQPYFIHMRDDRPFVFAGLWEKWSKGASPVETATIITTSPNELVSQFHDRMPVILSPESATLWLDHEIEDATQLLPLLAPYADDDLEAYLVSTLVNSPLHETPQSVEPLEGV